jgi:hypothetical protein
MNIQLKKRIIRIGSIKETIPRCEKAPQELEIGSLGLIALLTKSPLAVSQHENEFVRCDGFFALETF